MESHSLCCLAKPPKGNHASRMVGRHDEFGGWVGKLVAFPITSLVVIPASRNFNCSRNVVITSLFPFSPFHCAPATQPRSRRGKVFRPSSRVGKCLGDMHLACVPSALKTSPRIALFWTGFGRGFLARFSLLPNHFERSDLSS